MKYLYSIFSIFLLFIGVGIPAVSWSYGDRNNNHSHLNTDKNPDPEVSVISERTTGDDLSTFDNKVPRSAASIRNTRKSTLLLHTRLWYPLPDDALFGVRVPIDDFGFLSELIPYYHSISVLNNKYGVGLGIKLYELHSQR